MHFKANKSLILQAIWISSKAISTTVTLPVLSNILIEADDWKINFTATDLDLTIQSSIQADIIEKWSITINWKMFQSYLNLISENEIEFFSNETDINVKTLSSKTKFKWIKSNDFPKIEKPKDWKFIKLKSSIFRSSISEIVFSVSDSKARPILTWVLFSIASWILSLMSTDSYRMSYKIIPNIWNESENISVVIPSRTLIEIWRIIWDFESVTDEQCDLSLLISNNQIFFEIWNISIYSRLIEWTFPNCQSLIPKSSNTKVTINRSELVQAVKRMSIFAKEDNNKISFDFLDWKLNIKTIWTQVWADEIDIACNITWENIKVSLNVLFVIDVLSSIKKDEVIIEMTWPLTPVVFKNPSDENYTHIIMPLRT